jgi:tetratricopeptide (TPR) repeat protein
MSKNTDKEPGAAPKSSSADYPVDPAERINQAARLRKAAAAGASSLKSPIPSLMAQRPSPLAEPQKAPAPPAAVFSPVSVTERAPGADPAVMPEILDDRQAPPISDNAEILAELRKISAWADLQRRITKWSLIFLAVFIPVVAGIGILMERSLKTNLESSVSPRQPDWYDVERNVRVGDFEKAIAIGEELIQKTPQYPEAHQRLAGAYLASGNLEKAREHYSEAFRLFPSEENEKLLGAIEKRIKADKP